MWYSCPTDSLQDISYFFLFFFTNLSTEVQASLIGMLLISLETNLKEEWGFSDDMGNGEALYSLFFVKIIIIMTTNVRKYIFAKIIELLRRAGSYE